MSAISHHYNPQVYLRQFTNPKVWNQLWEYDLIKGTVESSSPKESGCEDYYHSFHREDGIRDDESLEKSFRSVENRLPKLFEAVRNKQPISVEMKANMLIFAALLHLRSPKTLHSLQNILVRQSSSNLTVNFTASREHVLRKALSALGKGDLQQLLRRMEWVFLRAPDGKHFFTSDDPVCGWPSDTCEPLGALGEANEHVEIMFPLTRRVCAFGNWKLSFTRQDIPLAADEVDAINRRTVENGYRFVYGPTNEPHILSLIVQAASFSRTG